MTLAAPIIFLILFTGGAIAILEKTGALDGLIYHVINKFRNQQLLFICIVAALFSILGTTGIIVNSVIGFIPISIIVAHIKMGRYRWRSNYLFRHLCWF